MTATSTPGRVVRHPAGVRLEYERVVAAPVGLVWAALTDPDRLACWFGRWTGDPATGTVQLVPLEAPDGEPGLVRIHACEAPSRLEVELASPDGPWPLTVNLTGDCGGTELRFVHELAEPYDATSIGPGWQYYLDRLDAVVAGRPVPDSWEDYHPALVPAYRLE